MRMAFRTLKLFKMWGRNDEDKNEASSPFLDLDEHIIQKIAVHLPLQDLKVCRLLNKRWRAGCNEVFYSKAFLSIALSHTDQDEEAIAKYLGRQRRVQAANLHIQLGSYNNRSGTRPSTSLYTTHAISFIRDQLDWGRIQKLKISLFLKSKAEFSLLGILWDTMIRVSSLEELYVKIVWLPEEDMFEGIGVLVPVRSPGIKRLKVEDDRMAFDGTWSESHQAFRYRSWLRQILESFEYIGRLELVGINDRFLILPTLRRKIIQLVIREHSPTPNLNEDVIHKIASYLPLSDLKTCRLLNKQWKDGVNHTFLAKSRPYILLSVNPEDEKAISVHLTMQQSLQHFNLHIMVENAIVPPQSSVAIHAISFIREKISWDTLRSLKIELYPSSRAHLDLLSILAEEITKGGSIVEEVIVHIIHLEWHESLQDPNAALEEAVRPTYTARRSILKRLRLQVDCAPSTLQPFLLCLGTLGTRRLEMGGMPSSMIHPFVNEELREFELLDWDPFDPYFDPEGLQGFGNLERLTLPLTDDGTYIHYAEATLRWFSPTLKQLEITLGWLLYEDSDDSEDEDDISLDPLEDVFPELPELRVLSVTYDFDLEGNLERFRFRFAENVLLRFPKLEELKLWPHPDIYAENIFRAFLANTNHVFKGIRKITLPRVETWAWYFGETVGSVQERFDKLSIKFPNAALNWI